MEMAEGVDEAGGEDVVEAGAFFVGESGAFSVLFGPGEVDLAVGDVEIAGKDDGLGLFELFHVGEEGGVPLDAVGETAEVILRVRGVDVDDKKVRVLGREDAAFLIVLGPAYPEAGGEHRHLAEGGDAGVTLLDRRIPLHVPARLFKSDFDLVGTGLHFLEEDHVRLVQLEEVDEALFEDGADAVHVPTDQFHCHGAVFSLRLTVML